MDGDIGQAFQWLRKRGIAKATSMADRSANEGEQSLSYTITVAHSYCRPTVQLGHEESVKETGDG